MPKPEDVEPSPSTWIRQLDVGSPGCPFHRVYLEPVRRVAWDSCVIEAMIHQRLTPEYFVMVNYLQSAADAASQPLAETAAHDEEFCQENPATHAYLTHTVDDTGKPRRTSTLVLFSEAGTFKGTLIERQHDVQIWATGDTLKAVIDALEAELVNPRPQWRKPSKGRR